MNESVRATGGGRLRKTRRRLSHLCGHFGQAVGRGETTITGSSHYFVNSAQAARATLDLASSGSKNVLPPPPPPLLPSGGPWVGIHAEEGRLDEEVVCKETAKKA